MDIQFQEKAGFENTLWTVVLNAARKNESQQLRAMEDLCRTYWFPLYAFIRKQGFSPEDSEDHTQQFFQTVVHGTLLDGVSPERGKFRSYLLACCKNFLTNVYHREKAGKRGGGATSISVDTLEAEGRYHSEITDHFTAEKAYDKAWALALLGHVVKDLETEYAKAGKERQFALLRPLMTMEEVESSYVEIAKELKTTESNLQIMVYRLRRKFAEKLREELKTTLEDPTDLESELRYLILAMK